VRSSPTLGTDGSVVYVGSGDNSLYAVNTANGTEKWSFATGGLVQSSPTLSTDGSVVYVGSDDNSLYAVNTRVYECQPSTGKCTCDLCCKAYIPDGTACVTCIEDKCPVKSNECQPAKQCNVCDACCQKYINDGSDCDKCVTQECSTPSSVPTAAPTAAGTPGWVVPVVTALTAILTITIVAGGLLWFRHSRASQQQSTSGGTCERHEALLNE